MSFQCNVCHDSRQPRVVFSKKSAAGQSYDLARCHDCGLQSVYPLPSAEEIESCYTDSYFTRRTDRGYDNYYSDQVRQQLERVFKLNLEDARFYDWLQTTGRQRPGLPLRSLDIGCAAGYFVAFMQNQGFAASGVELSPGVSKYAREELGLNVMTADVATVQFEEAFDFVTLWATLEHLRDPDLMFKTVSSILEDDGMFLLSTCRLNALTRQLNGRWRFLNVPEHLYYFTDQNLKTLAERHGFTIYRQFSYGSGLTSRKGASWLYRLAKWVADRLVKVLNLGDMTVVACIKEPSKKKP